MIRSATDVWDDVLRDMAIRLDLIVAAIDRGEALPDVDFTPPADLPPLPPECADQAVAVFAQNQKVESVVAALLANHPTSTRRVRPAPESMRSSRPARFDVSA